MPYKDKQRQKVHDREYHKKYITIPENRRRKNEYRKQRVRFKGSEIYVKTIPRIGICNWCRAVAPFDCKRTSLHHDENRYDSDNVLRYTIEICDRCHKKESWRLAKIM